VLLGLQAGGHLWGWWTGNAQGDLYTVVDEPLQSGQSTDHDDTGRQSVPHAAEAQGLGHAHGAGSLGLVQLGDHHISGMGDHGAEHTGDVASGEGHDQLLALGALGTGLGHHIPVEECIISIDKDIFGGFNMMYICATSTKTKA